jgi:hypothetical protein
VAAVLASLFTACLLGCGNGPRSAKDPAKDESPAKEAGKKSSGARGTEAEARAAVKAALDSWAFGDSEAQFAKAHPAIKFLDYSRITKKLARHEIGAARRDGNSFEFLVTLTFREEAGEVTRSGTYTVVKNAGGEWEIFGGAN